MAKKNFVILENTTNVSQQIFGENEIIHTLPALSRFPFPEDIANQFLTERAGFVRIFSPSIVPQRKGVDEDMVWIANVTGDPAAPAKVKLEDSTKNGPSVVEYSHTCHKLRHIEYRMHVDQKIVKDASGYDFAMNLPPVVVRIPPLETLHVPSHVASFLLGRAASCGAELGVPIKRVRAPGTFQPNPTWDLSDMWLYMEIMAADKFNAEKEKAVVRGAVPHGAHANTFKAAFEEYPHLVNELKQELWRHAFFYLIDDRYALVPEKVFNTRKSQRERAALKKQESEAVETALVTPKKSVGRPRKNA